MTMTQDTIASVRDFLAGNGPAALYLPELTGIPELYRVDGRYSFGLFDEDQVFPFTGTYMATTDGSSRFLCFQCDDFDIMVDLDDKEADLNGIPESFEDATKSDRIVIDDDEFQRILALVDDESQDMGAVDFANGYRLSYDEDEDKLFLSGDRLYCDYEVRSIMDYGIPFGGVVIELDQISLFFRNYSTVDVGGAC